MSGARLRGRLAAIARTSWRSAAWAAAAGLALQILLPVSLPWLPAVSALGFAVLALGLLALAEWKEPPADARPAADERALGRAELLERWGTTAQFGYAFGAGALLLLGLSLGLGLGLLADS
jgi:hypothetical protein